MALNFNEYRDAMREGDERDRAVADVIGILGKNFGKLNKMIGRDEQIDLWHDLIAFAYEQYDRYDASKGAKFSSYLYIRLRHFSDGVITRYTGIKTTRYQMRKHKENTGKPLVITVEALPVSEE